jgi:hypothetical protein
MIRVIEQRDEVRLVAPAIVDVQDARAVHDIAPPEFVGGIERKSATVLRRRLVLGSRHQALSSEQPMNGGWREHDLRWHALLLAGGGDQHCDTEGGVGLFQRTELIGHGLRQSADVPGVAPGTRLERVEAAAPIGVEPIAERPRSSRSPGKRLARQSGSRLKVSWAVGQ